MNRHGTLKLVTLTLMLLTAVTSNAADTYIQGNVTNLTSIPGGLLIMLDSGVPTNCTGTPSGWMLIRAADKTMIAMALTMFAMGKKNAVVYTSGILGSGYCEIGQYDPTE
jgi:hypothetical protein